MWEASYGEEPFDLRLTVLCTLRRLGLILTVTAVGTLLFGGGYYVKNVLLQPAPSYRADSTYRVDYSVDDEKDVSTVHINEMTWNTYMDTEQFLDEVRQYLPAGRKYTEAELEEALSAVVASDLKVLSTTVITDSPEKSLEIAAAVELALVRDFAGRISEVASISVMDPADEAEEVYRDVRPLRAVILSALLSFFFGVVTVLLKELGSDSIWIPATLRKRYGLQVLGTLHSPELGENVRYLFRGMKKIAVCPIQDSVDPVQALEALRSACGESEIPGKEAEWIPVPSPLLCPESCRTMREADGILLVLAAGSHAGKQLEYVMEYLRQQDCKLTSVLLWNADELLVNAYYGFRRKGEQADEG